MGQAEEAQQEQLRPQQGLLELAVPDGRANLASGGLAKSGWEEPRGVGVDRAIDAIEERPQGRVRHEVDDVKLELAPSLRRVQSLWDLRPQHGPTFVAVLADDAGHAVDLLGRHDARDDHVAIVLVAPRGGHYAPCVGQGVRAPRGGAPQRKPPL